VQIKLVTDQFFGRVIHFISYHLVLCCGSKLILGDSVPRFLWCSSSSLYLICLAILAECATRESNKIQIQNSNGSLPQRKDITMLVFEHNVLTSTKQYQYMSKSYSSHGNKNLVACRTPSFAETDRQSNKLFNVSRWNTSPVLMSSPAKCNRQEKNRNSLVISFLCGCDDWWHTVTVTLLSWLTGRDVPDSNF